MNSYQVLIARSALKELSKLPKSAILQVQDAINTLAIDPRPAHCKKLQGFKNLWRIRVGNYRVIYTINDSQLIIDVVKVGNRRDVYG